jgi:hypothetical protein
VKKKTNINYIVLCVFREASRGGGASKAFLTTDFVGQTFLCYLVPGKRELFFVKLEKTNRKEQLIFCSRTSVPARDAVPLTVNIFLKLD